LGGGFTPQDSVTLGRVFSLHEAFAGTIVIPYVLSMLFLHISMLDFTFILRVQNKKRQGITSLDFGLECSFKCKYQNLGNEGLEEVLLLRKQGLATTMVLKSEFRGR
jgi:hypothetical protein